MAGMRALLGLSLLPLALLPLAVLASAPEEPYVGQPGKDVVWVPTPDELVEKMLDMARVTPRDFVVDLGSGDGRNVIAAAKRGARALGVEFDEGLFSIAVRNARAAGVEGRARFVRGDMYEADISEATVLALFLLPDNLEKLKPQFGRLRPGSRIVTNGYEIPGWNATATETIYGGCDTWCTAYLYVIR